MAIFHFHAKAIKRSKGNSIVDIAARRSASALLDERLEKTFNHTGKSEVVHSRIILPSHVPTEFLDRSVLWNIIEHKEKRKDAQLARQIGVSLPKELSFEQQITLVEQFIISQFIKIGMIADVNITKRDKDNFYGYILLTMRLYNHDGFGYKMREWSHKNFLYQWREAWACAINESLKQAGFGHIRVDHRSHLDQGLDKEPLPHIGKAAFNAAKRGEKLDRWLDYEKVKNFDVNQRPH
jgi:ATP-dependent exoDNAse (exonuclease V) alpha subunit